MTPVISYNDNNNNTNNSDNNNDDSDNVLRQGQNGTTYGQFS